MCDLRHLKVKNRTHMSTTTSTNTKTGTTSGDNNAERSLHEETQKNISKVMQIECAQKANRTIGEKISEAVAQFCGSMTFVWVHVAWFGTWITVNSMPKYAFDPFPYTFLTLVVSLEAIFLSTFILISQNHDTQMSERRNHLDLQINMLAEQESTKTLDLLRRVAEKVGVKIEDPETDVLTESTEPDRLVDQIVSASQETLKELAGDNDPKPDAIKAN